MERPFVTIKEAAEVIPAGRTKIYQLIAAGHLDVRKLGKRTLISAESIRRLHDSLPKADIDRSEHPM